MEEITGEWTLILVACNDFAQYREWMKVNFPYFDVSSPYPRNFNYITPETHEAAMGFERGTCYLNPFDVEMPPWFVTRFTKIVIADTTPKHHSFGSFHFGE